MARRRRRNWKGLGIAVLAAAGVTATVAIAQTAGALVSVRDAPPRNGRAVHPLRLAQPRRG